MPGIISKVDPIGYILDVMLAEDVINFERCQQIEQQPTSKDRCRMLIRDVLFVTKAVSPAKTFLNALNEDYKQLFDDLRKILRQGEDDTEPKLVERTAEPNNKTTCELGLAEDLKKTSSEKILRQNEDDTELKQAERTKVPNNNTTCELGLAEDVKKTSSEKILRQNEDNTELKLPERTEEPNNNKTCELCLAEDLKKSSSEKILRQNEDDTELKLAERTAEPNDNKTCELGLVKDLKTLSEKILRQNEDNTKLKLTHRKEEPNNKTTCNLLLEEDLKQKTTLIGDGTNSSPGATNISLGAREGAKCGTVRQFSVGGKIMLCVILVIRQDCSCSLNCLFVC